MPWLVMDTYHDCLLRAPEAYTSDALFTDIDSDQLDLDQFYT